MSSIVYLMWIFYIAFVFVFYFYVIFYFLLCCTVYQLDELTANILSKETHLHQLQRELSRVQNGAKQKHKDMTSMEEQVRELEKKLKEIEWDHTDEVNTLQSRLGY